MPPRPRTLPLSALLGLALLGCAPHRAPTSVAPSDAAMEYEGPNRTETDLLRTSEGGSRIYVQAILPDGQPGLFLVDTGAAISVLDPSVATRIGLDMATNAGQVEGLGGTSSYDLAVADIQLGDAIVPDVEFAVGVRGVPPQAAMMPLAGILGNNVWQRFVLEVDYPADRMVLHRPGTVRLPRKHDRLIFDGHHVYATLQVTTAGDDPHTERITIQVDTGASDLMLSGDTGRKFERDFSEGVEPVLGIGASEFMPASQFLQRTRRIPVDKIQFGGAELDVDMEARWVNFDNSGRLGPSGMQGLAGHDLMAGHTVFFDYQGGEIALRKSRRRARLVNGHQVLYDQDVARYGDDPTRYLFRARMKIGTGDIDGATELLGKYLTLNEDPEARVLLANLHRSEGHLAEASQALDDLEPGDLVDEGELIAVVNSALLDGATDRALDLAQRATADRPDESHAWLAWADALLATGRYEEANAALLEAARLDQNPDAHLLRRARVALAQGDRYGAMAKIRRIVHLYPSVGLFLWFYSTLVDATDVATFRHDLADAMGRLHPSHRPLDFLMAAHQALGDADVVAELRAEGIARDCAAIEEESSKDNCLAWYYALSGSEPAESLRRIDRALAAEGDRSDFLDTKAMVHLARGEFREAHDAAIAAARLSPDDVYMLWQAERIGDMAARADAAASSARNEGP